MKQFELGFMCGIIEGEGYVGIVRRYDKFSHNLVSPMISVKNNSSELLNKILDLIGGHIYPRKWKNPKWQTSYELYLKGTKRVLPVLKELEPFLVQKRKRAQLVIEYCESRLKRGAGAGHWTPYSKREKEIIQYFCSTSKKV